MIRGPESSTFRFLASQAMRSSVPLSCPEQALMTTYCLDQHTVIGKNTLPASEDLHAHSTGKQFVIDFRILVQNSLARS